MVKIICILKLALICLLIVTSKYLILMYILYMFYDDNK